MPRFTHPLDDHVLTRGFAYLSSLYVGGQHAAADYIRRTKLTHGAPIRAAAAGKVVGDDSTSLSGWYVSIAHANGWTSHYRHLRGPTCAIGNVVQGQLIGYAGNTGSASLGAHLHFDLWCADRHDDTAFAKRGIWAHDPELYLNKEDPDMAVLEEHQKILDNLWARMAGIEQARDSFIAAIAKLEIDVASAGGGGVSEARVRAIVRSARLSV